MHGAGRFVGSRPDVVVGACTLIVMGVHRRDRNERLAAGAPPRIKVARDAEGKLELSPENKAEGVHPETVAEERPPQGDDPRPAFWRNVGGPWAGG